MGFRIALLILFFLTLGLILRGLMRKGEKGVISGGHIVLGHLGALLFGLIISPRFFAIIDQGARGGLVPILEMAFGWVGFLFGFQFNITTLRRIPRGDLLRAWAEAGVAFLTTAFISFAVLKSQILVVHLTEADYLKTALALGAVLSISSPTLVGTLNRQIRARSRVVSLLTVTTSVDGLIGVIILGVINLVWHPAHMDLLLSFGLFILIGIGQAFLLWLLLQSERKAVPTTILGIGVLTLGSGLSSYLGLAPVVTGALAGMVAANLAAGLRQRLARMLVTAESGLYFGLIVLTGVFLPQPRMAYGGVAILVICLLGMAIRFLGKMLGGAVIFQQVIGSGTKRGRELFSCSLQSAGALTLVAALCYNQTIRVQQAPLVVLVALTVFVGGEIIGIMATPRLLRSFKE